MGDGQPTPRVLAFAFGTWSGWEVWKTALPPKMQARIVAKKLLRSIWKNAEFGEGKTPLVVKMPWGSYQVIDEKGNLEEWTGEPIRTS